MSFRAWRSQFLNAILGLDLPAPIAEVTFLNPYNERESRDDKLSIVDIKARDGQGRLYQIEIQLLNHPDLPARMLYTWADLYSQQLQSGQDYAQLKPTYSIWLLGTDLLRDTSEYAHRYRLRDEQGNSLLDHGGIWLLEMNKFSAEWVETEQQRWLKFFKDGERLDDAALPEWMQTTEMRQAMNTLKAFSEKERAYHAYQARQDYLREQRAIQRYVEQMRVGQEAALQAQEAALQAQEAALQAQEAALQEKDAALQREDAALQREAAALAEIERLKARLQGQ